MTTMFEHGISYLANPLLLAKQKHARSLMASSYDRRGGNHDWSNYIRREGKAGVMMETDGPGCITRFWVADPQKGNVSLQIDGQHAIECKLADLFKTLPLSHGIGGESPENYARSKAESVPMGFTSYCPIPFQRHCKITVDPEDDYLYYQVNYHLFPPGTKVESFSPGSGLDTAEIRDAEKALANWKAGKPMVDMASAAWRDFELQPGAEATLLDVKGAGVVRGIRIKAEPAASAIQQSSNPAIRQSIADHIRDNVWLIAHFDEDEPRDPSIRAPIGPMSLDYGQTVKPRSLFVGTDAEGDYCFFPMPHYNKAQIKLVNRSILPVTVSAAVLHEPGPIEPDLLRFRATWHIETPFGPDHRDYEGLACRLLNLDGVYNVELLNVFGAGHFVGCGFVIDLRDAPTDRAAGEGDEIFFVDDDWRLTMNGTGTEDYLNDAWGIRGYVGPLSGDAVGGDWGKDPQIYGYRLHVPDPVPFTRRGRFTLEHGTGNNCSGLYRSVAYWYMDPGLTRTRTEEWRWEALRTGKAQMNDGTQ
ncbi:MAG: DUF2961 domain-containing protein [Fimbriimonadales bacterium]